MSAGLVPESEHLLKFCIADAWFAHPSPGPGLNWKDILVSPRQFQICFLLCLPRGSSKDLNGTTLVKKVSDTKVKRNHSLTDVNIGHLRLTIFMTFRFIVILASLPWSGALEPLLL